MNSNIFIIESGSFSTELLNFYLERELDVRVNNFFNFEELSMYLKLEPSVIIYDKQNCNLSQEQIQYLSEKLTHKPDLLCLENGKITHQVIDEKGILVNMGEHKLNNIYFSLVDACHELLQMEVENI